MHSHCEGEDTGAHSSMPAEVALAFCHMAQCDAVRELLCNLEEEDKVKLD